MNAMQEVAEKLKNCKDAAIRKEITKNNEDWSLTQHDQESRTGSPFFYDPDLLSSYDVLTFLIKLLFPRVQESLAAKLECRGIHENISIPGNVIDRQHARRDREELHNDSRNLATPWGIADDVEDSEKRRNWE